MLVYKSFHYVTRFGKDRRNLRMSFSGRKNRKKGYNFNHTYIHKQQLQGQQSPHQWP